MIKKIASLVFLLAFILQGCAGQTFTIPQGGHAPSPRKLVFHTGITTLKKTATFDSSCVYNLGTTDDGDINKLVGWSVGLSRGASVRVGWNCKSGYAIDLYAYLHYKGKRWIIPKDSSSNKTRADLIGKGFMTNQPIELVTTRSSRQLIFEATQGPRRERLVVSFFEFPSGAGFYEFPWFGGTSTAPHTMTIKIE